jgi:outer membrane biosynthesis protein TonB
LKNSSFEFVAKSRGEREKNESRNSAIKSDSDNSAPNKTKDDNSHPMIIIFQPAASFSPEARANATIRLRLNFSASGRISKVEVISPSDNGLIRQATFAALRIKFLPQEKNGQPVSITKVMEYRFRVG